ncbi:MAG TPA: asparagine synthase C-terminal domain-containing protein [Polyangiaceae bacterium]
MRTDLDPHGANLLTLSGGVDSSSLAALAAGPVGLSFSALSFLPAEERAFRHDLSFLEPLSQRFAFARHDVRLQPDRALAMRDLIPPVVFPVTHPPLCILSELCKKSPTLVLFGGEFADNFCGSKLTLGDWARHASALRLLLAPREIPWGFTGARTWVGHRVRRIAGRVHLPYPPGLPDFFTPDLQAEYSEWRLQQERTLLRDRLPRPELALGLKCCGSIAMNWEVSSFLGVRRAYPFFNREMLELAFRLHPSELLGPGVKKILRRALSGDVPARNLNRQDKGLASPERLKARMAWKAPLPHSLEPLFKPVFWRQPPRELEYLDALRLKQLVNIVRAIDIQTKSGAHALGHSP